MKIQFESDDDLPLDKTFNIPDMLIVAESVLEKNGKYYPPYYQKNVCFVIIGTLKMLDLNLNHMFVLNVTMY